MPYDDIKSHKKARVSPQSFTLSLEDTFFEIPQERGGVKLTPHPLSRFRVNMGTKFIIYSLWVQKEVISRPYLSGERYNTWVIDGILTS